jgi:hypothetical protein
MATHLRSKSAPQLTRSGLRSSSTATILSDETKGSIAEDLYGFNDEMKANENAGLPPLFTRQKTIERDLDPFSSMDDKIISASLKKKTHKTKKKGGKKKRRKTRKRKSKKKRKNKRKRRGGERALKKKDIRKWNKNKRSAVVNKCNAFSTVVNNLNSSSFKADKLNRTIGLRNMLAKENCNLLLNKFTQKANKAMMELTSVQQLGGKKHKKTRRKRSKRKRKSRRRR